MTNSEIDKIMQRVFGLIPFPEPVARGLHEIANMAKETNSLKVEVDALKVITEPKAFDFTPTRAALALEKAMRDELNK